MSDERKLNLSRRKVLGGLGTIGVASAGAGLGTSAFFQDTETFEQNTLTAGELDLRVDWEEHYWNDFDISGVTVSHVEDASDVGQDQIGLPDPQNPMIAVDQTDLDAFMMGTSIEAYPDSDGDGIQDDLELYDACAHFAQLDRDLDPDNGYPVESVENGLVARRSDNPDTRMIEGQVAPLINLQDVKPGDFGELTLSFHLCDNPGYVWLQGDLTYADENDQTEPEGSAINETGNATDNVTALDDPTAGDIELLDEIQTMLWYDEDGDNVYEPGGGTTGEADVVIVLDESGSMDDEDEGGRDKWTDAVDGAKSLIDELGPEAHVGLITFDSDVYSPSQTGTNYKTEENGQDMGVGLSSSDTNQSEALTVLNNIRDDQEFPDGSTNIEGAVIEADRMLQNDGRSGVEKIMVLLSDGEPNIDHDGDGDDDGNGFSLLGGDDPSGEADSAKADDIEIFTIGYGINETDDADLVDLLEYMASDPKTGHAFLGSVGEVETVFSQIGKIISGEETFFRGSLRELLDAVSDGMGIPLDGDRTTDFDEESDPADHANREEFVNSTNNFIGLSWWVPRSVGNHIQSDSVGFDLGFYTEQSRHNDGSGSGTGT